MILDTLLKELCSRLSIDYTDIDNNDLFTLTELKRWINFGKDEAVARYPWPFTEIELSKEAASGAERYNYPTGIKSDSIRYLSVNGKRYEKLLLEDYLKYKEDYPSGTDKVYSDRTRVLFINHLATDFGNSIIVYGQVIVDDMESTTVSSTVFSYAEPEGDEAIIKLAYSKALSSDKIKNPTKAKNERNEAFEILDGIWERIRERQHTYRTKDTPLFERLNVLEGGYDDEIRSRNQF